MSRFRVFVGTPGGDDWEDWGDEQPYGAVVAEMQRRLREGINSEPYEVLLLSEIESTVVGPVPADIGKADQ